MSNTPLRPDFTNSASNARYKFWSYDSYQDFITQGQEAFNELARKNRSMLDNGWFSSPSSYWVGSNDKALCDSGDFIDYIDRPALESAINAFESMFQKIDMGGAIEKDRLKFVERPGVFDFGLASKGLYAVQEFYSEELMLESPNFNLEFPTELPGIVPPLYVKKNEFGDFWYTSAGTGKKYQMTQQKKGQRAIDTNVPDAKYEYRTNTKKSYITFSKKRGKAKYVDLYVPIAAAGDLDSSGMLAKSLPIFIAAKYFESVGIRTKIYGARTYTSGSNAMCITWGIKDYGQPIDWNNTAIQTSDSRFFRWNLWRFTQAISTIENNRVDYAGNPVTGGDILSSISNRYKNWYFDLMEKGEKPKVAVDKNLMIFGGLATPPNSYTPNADYTDDTSQAIVDEFYRILDIVDFFFNDADKTVRRIADRMQKQREQQKLPKLDKPSLINQVRQRATDSLSAAYSYPTVGQYKADDNYIKEQDEKFMIKIGQMTKGLQQL